MLHLSCLLDNIINTDVQILSRVVPRKGERDVCIRGEGMRERRGENGPTYVN